MDIEVLIKSMLCQQAIKEREPYKICIERKNKGDEKIEVTVQGNEAEILNAVPNLIKRLVEIGVDKEMLKELVTTQFEKMEKE